jgi:hypothetical protein
MSLYQRLLQSALGKGLQRVPGIIDNLGAPIQKSVGSIGDALTNRRPVSKFEQRLVNWDSPGDFFRNPTRRTPSLLGGIIPSAEDAYKANFNPTQRFLQEYGNKFSSGVVDTAASLKPTSFPFDDPLTLLKGQARYAQRQIQGGIGQGIGQVGNIYRNLQGLGPTALNPLETRTPTTLLGKVGKTFNPLNPVNIGGLAAGGLISGLFSENDPNKGNAELFAGIPGLLPKIATTTILGATPAGVSDEQEANLIRQSNARSQFEKNYKVNGIEYDVKTGRAINPPANVFIPARSDSGLTPPAFTGGGQSNATGTPEQRRNVLQRATEVSTTAQQAAQNPMLQQYQNLRAASPAAAQNLGMQTWAQQYGGPEGLASQVKPGQSGYDVIQQVLAGQTPGSQAKVPGVVSQPWAEGVVSVGGATRAGLPLTSDQSIYSTIPEVSEEEMRKIMFNYRPEY